MAFALVSLVGVATCAPEESRTTALVRQLSELPAALPATARSDGSLDPVEERRRRLYLELWELGAGALPEVCRGLTDADVRLRRNVALFLNVTAGRWYEPTRSRPAIRPCFPALLGALSDQDSRVSGLSAQTIGTLGETAVAAVPALVGMLGDPDVGLRNSACIGLYGIGPAAKDALPALRNALSDANPDVRRFAARAIERIEGRGQPR